MNRVVLIGNGFDLAHNLPTSYKQFIDWYWETRISQLSVTMSNISEDILCTFKIIDKSLWCNTIPANNLPLVQNYTTNEILQDILKHKELFEVTMSPLFANIQKNIDNKKWVDIENEYYKLLKKYVIEDNSADEVNKLNIELAEIQKLLIEYLKTVDSQDIQIDKHIRNEIYSPVKEKDIAIGSRNAFMNYIDSCLMKDQDHWRDKMLKYGDKFSYFNVEDYKNNEYSGNKKAYPRPFMMPDDIMLLSFNYTKTASLYEKEDFNTNYIHGKLDREKSIIFGYGDELDENYKTLQDSEDSSCLANIKSIKYLESDNYRKVLDFIDSDIFQVIILGHSCGNSDRTLLNTIFEHKNCISIKPYYHKWGKETDNYIEIVQNISRNFKDMKLMRDRVVNKMYCDTL